MNRTAGSLAVVALSIGVFGCVSASQESAPKAGTLAAQDYIDIRQLIEG